MHANASTWMGTQTRTNATLVFSLVWLICGTLGSAPVAAQSDCAQGFDCYSVPGYVSWRDMQQPAADSTTYFPAISFGLRADGIAPIDTVWTVAVPDLGEAVVGDDLAPELKAALAAFARHVARDSVFAAQDVMSEGQVSVHQGDLLLPAYADFPRDVAAVRQLRQAGVDSVRALVNLAYSVFRSRRESNAQEFDSVVKSPTIYERQVDHNAKRNMLMSLFDDDPRTGMVRIDGLNRTVEKRAVVISMDLVARFPVRMVRFYPIPRDVPFPMAGFQVETHDGLSYKRGQELVEINQPRLGGSVSAADYLYKEGNLPVWDVLIKREGNMQDTIQVLFPEIKYVQQVKLRSLTGLDYDIAEFEIFGEGYVPSTQYLSRPMPVQHEAIPTMLAYLDGDNSLRTELDQLQGGTLGRIFWEEEKVGDPDQSSAVVSIQTGETPEPNILYRMNVNRDVVPWREKAQVIDRRVASQTSGELVNLDDPALRASAFDVWNGLSAEERAHAQTTTPEYARLAAGNKKDRKGNALSPEPDLAFWSGFQPVESGQIIPVPGERPFFQLRVDFNSKSPGAATIVRNLHFEHLYPAALRRVTGEIVPATGVRAGRDTLFTYALRPTVASDDRGFNRIRIASPVAIDDIEKVEFGYGTSDNLVRREAVEWTELVRTDSFFVVGIPTVTAAVSHADSLVVLVHFRSRVLATKTLFSGQVFLDDAGVRDSTAYDRIISILRRDPVSGALEAEAQILPQKILEGNALDFSGARGDRNSLDVVTQVDQDVEDVVMRARVSPNPFTPNDDGINDVVRISYDILRVVRPVPVVATVYDLSGRIVRRFESKRGVGEYTENWDGRDGDGQLVAPGMYIIKINAETDDGDFVSVRLLALAY